MHSYWCSCINYIRDPVLGNCRLETISVRCLDHYIWRQIVKILLLINSTSSAWTYFNRLIFLFLILNVNQFFINCHLFLNCSILSWCPLNIIYQFLKIAVIVHGLTHLHRFSILPLSILCLNIWKHILDSRIIIWLNHHHWIVIDTTMPHMMLVIFNKYTISTASIIFFHTLSHVKGLLTVDSCSCWSIRLNVSHIESSAIWRLAIILIIYSYSTHLSWEMHLIYRTSSGFCWASVRFN